MSWNNVDTLPEESGIYLCSLFDARDEYDDKWFDVMYFKKCYGSKGRWETCDFEIIEYWREIEPLPK